MSSETLSPLDSVEEMTRIDRSAMLSILESYPKLLEEALSKVRGVELGKASGRFQNITLLGLGGSAIGGDLAKSFLVGSLALPFEVSRGYEPPSYLNSSSLVLASSYSGDTEETLSAFQIALDRGARVACLTSGGELAQLAASHSLPIVDLPAGYPPRAALPFSLVGVVAVLERLGLVAGALEILEHSVDWVRERVRQYAAESPLQENPAKALALSLSGKVPVVYGSEGRLAAVARRWAGQFSENGKQLAYWNSLPEMNHNEIVGWCHPESVLERIVPVFLRDHQDHPRVQIRCEITRDLLSSWAEPVLEYWTAGESWMERLWTLILLGDFASVYLALLNREDPTPVESIQLLKTRLKQF